MILCGKRYIVGASLLNKLNRHRRFVLRPLFSELSLQWKSQSILSLHESAQYWINQKKRQFYTGPWVQIEKIEWLDWSINIALKCIDYKWGMSIWNWLFVCIKLILNELSIIEQSTKVLINQCNGYEGRLIRAMEAWMNNYQEPMLLPGEEIVIFSSHFSDFPYLFFSDFPYLYFSDVPCSYLLDLLFLTNFRFELFEEQLLV